jgi:predicted RNase H-like nuclease (RuvC/YqgF family)
MSEVLLTLLTSSAVALITWLLSKDKYKVEVSNTEIKNLREAFETYKEINSEVKKECAENKKEIRHLKRIITAIISDSCKVKNCKFRVPYEEDDAECALSGDDKDIITD